MPPPATTALRMLPLTDHPGFQAIIGIYYQHVSITEEQEQREDQSLSFIQVGKCCLCDGAS